MSERRQEFDRLIGPLLRRNPPIFPFKMDSFIGEMKLVELAHLVNTARFALWNAYRLDHDVNDAFSLAWIRSLYWCNAVLWYDACENVLCQVPWMALNLHGVAKDHREWRRKAAGACDYHLTTKRLKERRHDSLCSILNRYHGIKEVRDTNEWANELKHRGALDFEGLDFYHHGIALTRVASDGQVIYTTDDVLPPVVRLEDGIKALIRVHKEITQSFRDVDVYLFGESDH